MIKLLLPTPFCGALNYLVDVSEFFFSVWGRGRGSPGDREGGGVGFLLKISGAGGVISQEEVGRGPGWPGGCLQGIWGGGG